MMPAAGPPLPASPFDPSDPPADRRQPDPGPPSGRRPVDSPESHAGSVTLPEKIRFLRTPASYPVRTSSVETRETHLSWVFLTEQRAYKLKKPMRNEFVNLATSAARRAGQLGRIHNAFFPRTKPQASANRPGRPRSDTIPPPNDAEQLPRSAESGAARIMV